MTYVDSLPTALASIGQIQSAMASLPAGPSPSGFEGVLQQISTITDLGAQPGLAASNPGGADLSGSYGWPLEEGNTLSGADAGASASAGASQDYQDEDLNAVNTMAPASSGPAATGFASATLGSPGLGSAYASLPPEYTPPGSDYTTSGSGSTSVGSGTSSLGTTPGPPALGAGSAGPSTAGVALPGEQSSVTGAGSTATADLGQEAVSQAQKFLGVPYLWGGTNPAQGVDCSGLVQDVYGELGVDLPRTSQEQALVGQAVPTLAEAQPGDLVFYPGSDGTATAPGHVGIYIGNGQMIDAPYTGTVVQVNPVGDPVAIRRVTGLAASPAAPGPSGTPSAYQADFALAANVYGVPQQLLSAVASTESSYQPGAVSSAGAEGLMQLMPSVASSLGVNPFDPQQAVDGAARLLSSYHSLYGSWSLALAAYNAGPGAVDQYSGIPPYPQTQAYVQNVLSQAGMEDQ